MATRKVWKGHLVVKSQTPSSCGLREFVQNSESEFLIQDNKKSASNCPVNRSCQLLEASGNRKYFNLTQNSEYACCRISSAELFDGRCCSGNVHC
ncbi:hypothetical protein BaRGS_00021892 [Batillaria attramentaria]|uniref:Uncharacterized protein n=1 Tax=Batillaria attramentaria TaxID=370345 RepID=A0ABD0KIW7_9CAEN